MSKPSNVKHKPPDFDFQAFGTGKKGQGPNCMGSQCYAKLLRSDELTLPEPEHEPEPAGGKSKSKEKLPKPRSFKRYRRAVGRKHCCTTIKKENKGNGKNIKGCFIVDTEALLK
jgi:hypothetical protein